MDDDDQPHSLLRRNPAASSSTTSFFLPLTRLPRRLLTAAAAERQLILSGAAADEDDDSLGILGCAYWRPILVVDMVWNMAFVAISALVLLSTFDEKPSTPLRLWISGYALHCFFHVALVCLDYRRRSVAALLGFSDLSRPQTIPKRIIKKLETANTISCTIWWMLGFYWIVLGGQALLHDSPGLYWIAVVFLAFDVFFIIFCIGMSLVFFLALYFCVPALAFFYSIRDGASDDDIRNLPRYRYYQDNPSMTREKDKKQHIPIAQLESGNNNHIKEFTLDPEDSECCICLCRYVNGAELCTLPCSHHFHCGCISKWLRINATCPLCKFNILSNDTLV